MDQIENPGGCNVMVDLLLAACCNRRHGTSFAFRALFLSQMAPKK
jgi:hypothetical protein